MEISASTHIMKPSTQTIALLILQLQHSYHSWSFLHSSFLICRWRHSSPVHCRCRNSSYLLCRCCISSPAHCRCLHSSPIVYMLCTHIGHVMYVLNSSPVSSLFCRCLYLSPVCSVLNVGACTHHHIHIDTDNVFHPCYKSICLYTIFESCILWIIYNSRTIWGQNQYLNLAYLKWDFLKSTNAKIDPPVNLLASAACITHTIPFLDLCGRFSAHYSFRTTKQPPLSSRHLYLAQKLITMSMLPILLAIRTKWRHFYDSRGSLVVLEE